MASMVGVVLAGINKNMIAIMKMAVMEASNSCLNRLQVAVAKAVKAIADSCGGSSKSNSYYHSCGGCTNGLGFGRWQQKLW